MGMVVRTNTMAINANRQLGMNNSAVAKSLEKLSSGFKINRAADDASGLAISEKMKAQIKGLDQASANSQDGISLIQTAEGAATEIHDMLNRMVELATKSANGTIQDDVDREAIQREVDDLNSEISRIAKSTNFNGIDLLNGNLKGTTAASAVEKVILDPTDGTTPNAATKATFTIKLDGTNAIGAGTFSAIQGGTSNAKNLGDISLGDGTVADLFEAKLADGTKLDLTNSATSIAAGAEIILTAKTAGQLSATVAGNFTTSPSKGSIDFTNGLAEGAGSPATKAKYTLEFDFTKIADGQTFKIGDKTFEISTDGTAEAGHELIDLKGLDLTAAGTSNAKGQWGAAAKIQGVISSKLGADFAVDTAPQATITGDKYTINFEAKAAGDAGNQGAVRVSEAASGAISGTYAAGKAAGKANPGSFASVSYKFDATKLAVGDELTIGTTKLTVVDDADEDLVNGKIGATKAAQDAEIVKAFESNGYASGKITIANGKLTVTGTKVGETAEDLGKGNGKIAFASAAGAAITGGLTLQVGDTNQSFNQVTVSVDDLSAKGIGTEGLDVSTQAASGNAIQTIKDAINQVSTNRANLGSLQNRLEHTINNLDTTSENMSAANSRIRDTDMAKEMMNYTKMNVLVQSAQAMLAQANQQPQSILQLLQ